MEKEFDNFFFMVQGLESMYSFAQKCMQIKPASSHHKLMGLLIGILGENPEVISVYAY